MKNKKYLITAVVIFAIISLIYIVKGIFPFGSNFAIWSDLHEQITAIYYHFYDAVRGSKSLLVDFTSGGGLNFVGVIGYYILSPFSLITLLFPRELVAHSVSIIIALKIMLSGITCLYFISKYFKKVPNDYQILFSVLYAFCGYNLILYIITPWMDVVCLFPLLLVGLKKLLDLEGSKLYIIILSLSLIFCFYLTLIVLLFIIVGTIIYLYINKKKINIKKAIFNLAISSIISILISAFIFLPSMLQIGASQRAGFDLNMILNSKLGPISDKITFFFLSGVSIAIVCLLLLSIVKSKKKLIFIISLLVLIMMPIIVEPINKLFHFGSYVFFPLRYGFIPAFIFICIALYYFENMKEEKTTKKKMLITLGSTVVGSISLLVLTKLFYTEIQQSIDKLTFTSDIKGLIIVFLMFLITFAVAFIIGYLNKNRGRFAFWMFTLIAMTNIIMMSFIYIGIDFDQKDLQDRYKQMIELNNIKDKDDIYYVKREDQSLIRNFGMVSGYHTYTNFTSLTDKTNFETMQRLGYDSYWMDTESSGGNLFADILLAQKYIVSEKKINNEYYSFIDNYKGINFYKANSNISYGYLASKNVDITSAKNSFDASNMIYKSITNNGNIFTIVEDFELHNIKKEEVQGKINLYREGNDAYLFAKINVTGRNKVYFEVLNEFNNTNKFKIYKKFAVYVNDKLLVEGYPYAEHNGTIELGTYENEEITVKIQLLGDAANKSVIDHINIGILDLEKLENFIKINTKTEVTFSGNDISIKIDSEEDKILFLPITYLKGYKATNNDKDIEIIKMYDNFVGIKLDKGKNKIDITYKPEGLNAGILISIIGIFVALIWIKYIEKKNFKVLNSIFYFVYLIVCMLMYIGLFIIPTFYFLVSFLKRG